MLEAGDELRGDAPMGPQVRLTLAGLLAICTLLQGAKVVGLVGNASRQGTWGQVVWPVVALLVLIALTVFVVRGSLRKPGGAEDA